MKIVNYQFPKSSFLSVDKDMALITNRILRNDRLKKLLFYNSRDALERPPVSQADALAMFGKNIKNVPKLYVDGSVLTYIIINFDNFQPSGNPEFRDNIIEFDIICHFDQWPLKDFALRPYKIAAELDTMFNNKHLTGIGDLQFLGANQILLTNEFAGLCLMYQATHGEEDKKNPIAQDDQDFIDNFDKLFNLPEEVELEE